MARTVLIEPVGLASADRIAAVLLEEEYRLTGLPAVLVHLDLTRRGLAPSDTLFIPAGAVELWGSFADALTNIARGESPALQAAPLQGRNGRIVYPGVDLEGAWQQVEAAALASGLSLPVAARLSSTLDAVAESANLLLLTTPGLSPLTMAAIAQANLVVLCYKGEAARDNVAGPLKRIYNTLKLLGDRCPEQLLALRTGGPQTGDNRRHGVDLLRYIGWPGEATFAVAASDDEDALRQAIRRPWLHLRGVTD